MKKMAAIFLVIGIISIGISIFLYNQPPQLVEAPKKSLPLPEPVRSQTLQDYGIETPKKQEPSETENNSFQPAEDGWPTETKQQKSATQTTKKTVAKQKASAEELDEKEKGNQFENFVIQYIGKASSKMVFRGKNSDYHSEGVSATENMTPDLKFSLGDEDFAVECKWRDHFYKGKIDWAKDYQVVNYGRYEDEHDEPVFVAIGIGGTPAKPKTFYLMPLKRLSKTYATEDYLKYNIVRSKKGALNFIEDGLDDF